MTDEQKTELATIDTTEAAISEIDDDMAGKIVEWRKGILGHVNNLRLLYMFPPMLAMIGRNFPGQLSDVDRAAKTRAHIEQAWVYMSNAKQRSKLTGCTAESVLQTICDSAALGLTYHKAIGEAYMVPYKQVCTHMTGYTGFIRLLMQTGAVASVQAEAVYEGERNDFRIRGGTNPGIEHDIRIDIDRSDKNVIAAYCIINNINGPSSWSVLNRQELEKVRASSKAKEGPWNYWYGEMAKKSAVRRAQKLVIKNTDKLAGRLLVQAVEIDDRDHGLLEAEARESLVAHGRELREVAESGEPAEKREPPEGFVPDDAREPKPHKELSPDGEPVPDWVGKEQEQ